MLGVFPIMYTTPWDGSAFLSRFFFETDGWIDAGFISFFLSFFSLLFTDNPERRGRSREHFIKDTALS